MQRQLILRCILFCMCMYVCMYVHVCMYVYSSHLGMLIMYTAHTQSWSGRACTNMCSCGLLLVRWELAIAWEMEVPATSEASVNDSIDAIWMIWVYTVIPEVSQKGRLRPLWMTTIQVRAVIPEVSQKGTVIQGENVCYFWDTSRICWAQERPCYHSLSYSWSSSISATPWFTSTFHKKVRFFFHRIV